MKYLSIDSVVNAFEGCKGKTQNKFWGMLAIIKAIGQKIVPAVNYSFSTSEVSDFLEELFRLEDKKKKYISSARWSVMFSRYWIENIPEQMFDGKPNIYDVAVWYYRTKIFDDELTSESLVKMLLNDMHISLEDAHSLFNFSNKNISFTQDSYKDSDLLLRLQKQPFEGLYTISFESQMFLKSHPGALGQAPFVQTLYANQGTQKCLILTQFDFSDYYRLTLQKDNNSHVGVLPLQQIFFGTPGSGKSFKVKREVNKILGEMSEENKEKHVFRTTFHPDSDYASFVGCYKPMENDSKITYSFVPQTFTNAYVAAWNDLDSPYFLIIEEINRGNCAQIFGDLFQLLDRKGGYSEYKIKADNDLHKYLEEHLTNEDGIKNGELCLPPNLYIWATMNTSDQSLFPMDSAFKRRWSWEYVPIEYDNEDSSKFTITIDGKPYSWPIFLKKINEEIKKKTSSEDKQMGNFFIKQSIDEKEFKDKVMFYIWSEVGKENYNTPEAVFKNKDDKEFSFNQLYGKNSTELLKGFLEYLDNTYFTEEHLIMKDEISASEQDKEEADLNLTNEQ